MLINFWRDVMNPVEANARSNVMYDLTKLARSENDLNPIEKEAREIHGGTLYNLTWMARSEKDLSKKKRLWTLTGLVSVGAGLVWWVACFTFAYMLVSSIVTLHSTLMEVLLLAVPVAYFAEALVYRDRVMSRASTFYAIAADYKRHGMDVTDHKKFLINGGLSYLFARLVWLFWSHRTAKLAISELDVLGSIFSKVGKWGISRKIFREIQNRHLARNQEGNAMQTAISFALACKWMLDEADAQDCEVSLRKEMIRDVMREYPELPPEIAARLYEGLGEKEAQRFEEEEIARRYA